MQFCSFFFRLLPALHQNRDRNRRTRTKAKYIAAFTTTQLPLRTTVAAKIENVDMNGFRNSLVEEFDHIYVFNLRGNQRTQGEVSRREGGKIFGSGSRTPVAITILVKTGEKAK